MKILVTGATGFIGSHVIENLVQQGHSIIATARNAEKAKKFPWFDKTRFVTHDLNYPLKNAYDFFDKPELLIHLAWEGLPNYRSSFHLEKNCPVQCAFINQMIVGGLPSVTVMGTCLEYGMKEGCLTEDISSEPEVTYAQAKKYLQEYIVDLQKKHDFSFKWIRLFYTYGRGQNENAILSQLDRALEQGDKIFNMSGGEQLRDYLPVEQLAQYIIKIAFQDRVRGIVNCCSGEPISIKKFVENYLASKKKSIELNLGYYPYLDYEPMAFWGDTRKLKVAING